MHAALMHEGLERAAARFGGRDAIRADGDRWSFADLDGWANAVARHLRDCGVQATDRVAVMTSNRVEFLVVVEAISRLGRGRGPAQPGVEGDRGGPRPRRSPGPGTPWPRRPRRPCSPRRSAAGPSSTWTTRRRLPPSRPLPRAARARRGDRRRERGGPRLQLGHHRPAQGGAPHPRLDRPGHHRLVRGPGSRARGPVPGGHAAVPHPRPAQPAGRRRGRAPRSASTDASTSTPCSTTSSPNG